MLRLTFLALFVAGCGAPFTAADADGSHELDAAPRPDAGPDAVTVVHDSGVVESSHGDATEVDSGVGVETGSPETEPAESAPPPETGPVCTTTGGTLGPAASPCLYNGSGYQWPAYFVSDYPGSDICEPQNTPSVCSCVETYNCACMLANVGCDPGFTKTCQAGSNGVTVVCGN